MPGISSSTAGRQPTSAQRGGAGVGRRPTVPRCLCIMRGPKCSNDGFAVPGTSRCPAHSRGWRKTPEMQSRSSYYSTSSWRQRRAKQLREHPTCVKCGAPATVADHIDPIGLGGDWFGPLQSMCTKCHNRKSSSEGGKASKAKRKGQP